MKGPTHDHLCKANYYRNPACHGCNSKRGTSRKKPWDQSRLPLGELHTARLPKRRVGCTVLETDSSLDAGARPASRFWSVLFNCSPAVIAECNQFCHPMQRNAATMCKVMLPSSTTECCHLRRSPKGVQKSHPRRRRAVAQPQSIRTLSESVTGE